MTKTKKRYEKYLNQIECPEHDSKSNGGRCNSSKYGTWLRRNDPIAFEVGYSEWTYR
jgi:hypothetical protein